MSACLFNAFILSFSLPTTTEYFKKSRWDHFSISSFQVSLATLNGATIKTLEISKESKRFKALMKVRPKVKRIVGLTGTPSSNGLMDLWAEFRLLDMGERLGRFIGQYREIYFKPDKRNGPIIYSYKPLPFAEDAIYEKISDITVSMKAEDYLKMPFA